MDDVTRNDAEQSSSSHNLSVAVAAIKRGWIPIPITPSTPRRPLVKYVEDRSMVPTSPADAWTLWTEEFPGAAVAILTGSTMHGGSGLLVIDVDTKNGAPGETSLAAAVEQLGELPVTRTARTPSGGRHLVFRYPDASDEWRNWQGWRPGIDVRGHHGLFLAPGSDDARGRYEIEVDVEPAELPPLWLSALRRPAVEIAHRPAFAPTTGPETPAELARQRAVALDELDELCRTLAQPGPGKHGRLVQCATIAGSWSWAIGDDELVVARLLDALGKAHDVPGGHMDRRKSERDVRMLLHNGQVNPKRATFEGTALGHVDDYGLAVPGSAACPARSWDDLGNARRLVDHYGAKIRYALDAGSWIVYDAWLGQWRVNGGETIVQRYAQDMLEELPGCEHDHYSTTPNVSQTGRPEPSDREQFHTFVGRSRSHAKVRAMIGQASSLVELGTVMTEFDTDPLLLNVANGVVDLRTGKLRAHAPELMLSQLATVTFEPGARSPLWEKFLADVQPDPEVRAYLARVVGYTLTGSTGEQKMWIHHGTGANGKSVFVTVLGRVLGSYAQTIPRSTLLAKSGDAGVPTDLARMVGRRMLTASETAAGRRLDGELVKELTGGEPISARFLHRDFFEFRPVGKIHLTTNHVPQLGADDAIRRRLETVGWNVVVPPERRDPFLTERLLAEAPGILAWAIEGCLDWQRSGLSTPAAVVERTDEHLAYADPLGEWVRECLERVPGAACSLGDLFESYRAFAERSGERPMIRRSLSEALTERGFGSELQGRNKTRTFLDVTVRPTSLASASSGLRYGELRSVDAQ